MGSQLPLKRAQPLSFRCMSVVAKRLDMKAPLGTEVDLGPGHVVLDGVPVPRERGTAAPYFRPMSIVAAVVYLCYC